MLKRERPAESTKCYQRGVFDLAQELVTSQSSD